jgi:ParB-like chromosome segregation protein Spo0J
MAKRRSNLTQQPNLDHISEQLRPFAVAVDLLTPDPANARKHGERNLETIRASLVKFGFRQPIVVQKQGMIVRAGNARLLIAKTLGWTHVPALIVDEADVEATAYGIADNRTSELAEWDKEILASLLESLPDADAAGWNEAELKGLLKRETSDQTESLSDLFEVVVECQSEKEQQDLVDELMTRGLKVRALIA